MFKIFEPWEEAFILLTYIDFSYKEIANYLNRGESSINHYVYRRKLKKKYIYIGQVFERLIVISPTSKKWKCSTWNCKCECGNITTCTTTDLRRGYRRSCGCLTKEESGFKIGAITGNFFNAIKGGANWRELEINIDKQILSDIFESQGRKCALSGIPLKIIFGNKGKGTTASVDRIDSSRGYTKDNIQFVHKDVNRMKSVYSQDYFIKMCKLISSNHYN
jgi:hypothetical protein